MSYYASHLGGNFTLKRNEKRKLAFIAGGIGITPFRSMVKYAVDKGIDCDVVLIYAVSDPREFSYIKQLKEAQAVGVKTIPVVTDKSYQASGIVSSKIDAELLAKLIPDYSERTFYISGPNAMVDATKDYLLHSLHMPKRHIKTDHFSGY